MLKHRIIPVLLWDGIQCVKPVAFSRPYRKLGSMEQYVQIMERRNIDELIIIDIEATPQQREPNYDKLRELCNNLYCPVTYGGGIRTLDHIRLALANGADKVAIRNGCSIIKKASEKFGAQAITYVLDCGKNCLETTVGTSAQWAEDQGAGEILLTQTLLDGTLNGYDIYIIKETTQSVDIPVIANGGCGKPEHMAAALDAGASAVAAGSMFLYTEHTPRSCAKYLQERGYVVRV